MNGTIEGTDLWLYKAASTIVAQQCGAERSTGPLQQHKELTRWMCAFPLYVCSSCCSVGMRAPANAAPNQLPASSCCSCARVCSATAPVPSFTRPSFSSCTMTTAPSLESWQSVSKLRKPCCRAASNACTVFSGAAELSPLWAMIVKYCWASIAARSMTMCQRATQAG